MTCTCGPWVVEGDPMFRTARGSWHKGSCPLHIAKREITKQAFIDGSIEGSPIDHNGEKKTSLMWRQCVCGEWYWGAAQRATDDEPNQWG